MHTHKDDKAEWCKERGFSIESIRGDGNCLYTCLGKSRNLFGHQVRQIIHTKAELHWKQNMEYDIDGSGYDILMEQMLEIKEWGGFEQ
eukprot:14352142-Heterocapsa_arctica.AAC.1